MEGGLRCYLRGLLVRLLRGYMLPRAAEYHGLDGALKLTDIRWLCMNADGLYPSMS